MQSLKQYILAGLLLVPIFSFSQKNEELIDWSSAKRLDWADYKGRPNMQSDVAAITTTYLGVEYNFAHEKITYSIQCRFSKSKSWGAAKTPYILSHEQGHFDITEIFARKLNKMLSEYQFNRDTYQRDLKKIYEDVQAGKEALQNQYDEETDFSRNKEKQAEWLKKIADELEKLAPYAGYN